MLDSNADDSTTSIALVDPALEPHKGHGLPRGGRAARAAAKEIDSTSGLRVATPVRKSFVRVDHEDEDVRPLPENEGSRSPHLAPLIELYRGGRSGIVPIKLYLALIWRSSSAPWSSDKPSRAWAVLLGLEDPAGAGSRRIRAAIRALEAVDLVRVQNRKGHSPTVTLLREDGSGARYNAPADSYQRATATRKTAHRARLHRYFKINSKLWTTGEIQGLSGSALVMLLILLSERGGDGHEVWFSVSAFQERYGLSPTTRAKGVKELRQRGLLNIEHRSLPAAPGRTVFDPHRKRHVYFLDGAALTTREGEETVATGRRPRRQNINAKKDRR